MRLCIDIRIHAQRNRRLLARGLGDFVQRVQFGNRLDVEALHAGIERFAHFSRRLADARKHGVFRFAARSQHARQFTRRDDVEARAQPREHVQHGEIAVRFHGDVDRGAVALAGIGVSLIGVGQRAARIHVERRAELFGQRRGRNAFDLQHAFGAREYGLSHEFSGSADALGQLARSAQWQRLFAGRRGFGCRCDAGDFRLSSGESESGCAGCVGNVAGTSRRCRRCCSRRRRIARRQRRHAGGTSRNRRCDGHIKRSALTTRGEQRAGGNGQSRYNRAHPENDLHRLSLNN